MAVEPWHNCCACCSKALTGRWVILSAGFGHRWPWFLALCSIWFHSVSFCEVPVSCPWQGRSVHEPVLNSCRCHSLLWGGLCHFPVLKNKCYFWSALLRWNKLDEEKKELETAARSYGQRLSLAERSDLWRQERERAPSFHWIPLLRGGGIHGCQSSHVSMGRRSGKVAVIDFSLH